MCAHHLKIVHPCLGHCGKSKIVAFFDNTMSTLLIQVFANPFLHPPGQWSSRGREQSQTTRLWARDWGRPSPPTSKWQRATITAGTLEARQWISLWERHQKDRVKSDTVLSPLQFGQARGSHLHAQMWSVQTALTWQEGWDTTVYAVTYCMPARGGTQRRSAVKIWVSETFCSHLISKVECFS